jgi:hypothetical protein
MAGGCPGARIGAPVAYGSIMTGTPGTIVECGAWLRAASALSEMLSG